MTKIIETEKGAIPEIKTVYWYLRSNTMTNDFVIVETEWIGGFSDLFRLAKCNVYLDKNDAIEAQRLFNERLSELVDLCADAKQKERLKEEADKKKEAAAERKREREKNLVKKKPSRIELYKRYEKKKKSPHPDIVI